MTEMNEVHTTVLRQKNGKMKHVYATQSPSVQTPSRGRP